MSKWVKLKSIADLTVGFVGTMAKHYENEGVPFLRSLNIKPFKIVDDDMKYISQEFCDKISKSILHEGDVVIVRTGLPGTCCVVPAKYNGCNCSDVVIVHPDAEVVNAHYLAAFINIWGQRQIHNNKVGAIQQHFNVRSAEEMLIYLPEKEEQEKIAGVVVAINEKIKNNNIICSELEAMAKTLYDYWFVQFDFPDENGKPYRTSSGEMVWNEHLKREIPKGWEAKNIQEVCAVVDCLHSKKPDLSFESENYYLLQLDNLVDMGLLDLSKKYYVSANDYAGWTSKIEVRCGDLVITNAGRVGDIARIPEGIICGIGRNMTAIRAENVDPIFMYYFFASSDMKAQIKSNTDTGSFFGSLNVRGIKQLIMPIPPKESEIMNRFIDIVHPIRENVEMVAQQSQELSKLRDWLLPMLMNGQARVE